MRYRNLFIFFVVTCLCLTNANAQREGKGDFFLQRVLQELSLRNGDLFGLELFEGGKDGPRSSPAAEMDLNLLNAYTSSEKLLQAYFPEYEVVQSRVRPRFYFVISRRTNGVDSYGMKQKLDAVRFEGSATELIAQIGKTVPSIKPISSEPLPNLYRVSMWPRIASGPLPAGTVRDVLCARIDVDRTKGIAWVATTRLEDGQPKTEVAYTSDAVFLDPGTQN